MEIGELIKKVFTNPAIPQGPVPGVNDPFLGVKPDEPKVSKNDMFNPNILAEAQKSFAAGTSESKPSTGGSPNPGATTPSKGTVSGMIPPGWSSQSK